MSQLCSTMPLTSSVASWGQTTSQNRSRAAASGSESKRSSNVATARSNRSRGTKLYIPRIRPVWNPRHQNPRSRRRKARLVVRPSSSAGRPRSASTWNLHSTGISRSFPWRPSSRATMCVPLRPVPPTKLTGGTRFMPDSGAPPGVFSGLPGLCRFGGVRLLIAGSS